MNPSQWRLAWRERWAELRNRLLGSPRFHAWASRFPLTRPIARRQAGTLFDLCAGFVYSQILLACVQLRLFERLAAGPQDLVTLAAESGLSRERMTRLLDAAVALELIDRRGQDRFGLGPHGAVLAGNEGIQAMVRHHAVLYADLADPLALFKDEVNQLGLARYWAYADNSQSATDLKGEQVSEYSELMAASQSLIAEQVLASYSLRQHRCVLDVGGGQGAFLSAVASRWPHLDLMLFDLPAVADRGKQQLTACHPGRKVQTFGGDFFADPLPPGADLITLVRVIHDHNDPEVLKLLQAVRRQLPANGVLLLAEPMAGDKATDRVADAYFGLYLLAMGKGRARSPTEIGGLLTEAGFSRHRLLVSHMPLQTRVMVAYA
jgi:demethylspheroidene O-methyltransferase